MPLTFSLNVLRRSNATRKQPSADRHRSPEKTPRIRRFRSNPSPRSVSIPFETTMNTTSKPAPAAPPERSTHNAWAASNSASPNSMQPRRCAKKMKLTKKRVAWAALSCVGLLLIFLFVVPLFLPWSEFNCSHQEIDINTGRIRSTEYRLFFKVSDRIEDTALSNALSKESVSDAGPSWHKVNTFSPGIRHSPHYIFHSAAHQIWMLEQIWAEAEYSGFTDLDGLKKATAEHVLALWVHGGSDWLAGQYLARLSELAYADDPGATLEPVVTLTMPIQKSEGDKLTKTVFFPDGRPLEQLEGYKSDSGKFVRHGIWEQWSPDGTRLVYGHFKNGEHDGPRYAWDRDGNLSSISAYNKGALSDFDYENLAGHPEYKTAQQVGGAQCE